MPVDATYLAANPEVAAQVPLAAPSEAGKADKYVMSTLTDAPVAGEF